MIRQVPAPPLLSPVHRGLARLPLGGPTGLACAAAGVACVIGLLLFGPSVGLPSPFRDERVIAAQAPRAHESARPGSATTFATKAARSTPGAPEKPPRSTSGSSGGNQAPTPTAEADHPGADPTPDPTPRPTSRPAPEFEPSSEPDDSARLEDDHNDWERTEEDHRDEPVDDGEHRTP